MRQSINRSQFHDAFANMNRKDNFSYEGLNALFDYLESFEDEAGSEITLDVIGLCCEYTEAPITDVLRDFNLDTLEEIEDRTRVIKVDDKTIIYGEF